MKEQFKDLYKKYIRNIHLSALITSLLILLPFSFILSIIYYFTEIQYYHFNHIVLIDIIFFIGLFVTFMLINKPTEEKFAKYLDGYDLKQRMITMKQYENDESFMAKKQREDTIKAVNKLDKSVMKFSIKIGTLIFLISFLFANVGSISLLALSDNDIIDSGNEIIEELKEKNNYEICYEVDGEGYIEGDIFQVIEEGSDGSEVYADAEDGWVFYKWSDGYDNPYRCEKDVYENLNLIAIFVEIDEEQQDNENSDDGEPKESKENDEPKDLKENDESSPSEDPSDQEGGGAGGKYEPNNSIVDGETYYGDSIFDNAYNDAIENLQNNNMSDNVKNVINDYYKNIEK